MKVLRITMTAGVATLWLVGEIGEWGWTPQLWGQKVAELREKGCTALQVRINSPGGSVVDALAICDCIEELKKEMRVEAVVCGMCASAATLIALVCDSVTITANSTWMVHEPSCGLRGTAAELRAQLKAFEDARARVYALYAAATGKTVEQLEADHRTEVYYTAEEAVAYGFCRMESATGADAPKEEPKEEPTEPTEAPEVETEEKDAPEGGEARADSPAEGAAEEAEEADGEDAGEDDDKASMFARFCAWMRGERAKEPRPALPRAEAESDRAVADLRAQLVGARASLETALAAAEKSEAEFTARVNAAVAAKMATMQPRAEQLPAAEDTLPRVSMAEVAKREGLNSALALLGKIK